VDPRTKIGEAAVVLCDAIAVEIHGIAVERELGQPPHVIRPLVELACRAINDLLSRIRVLIRAGHLKRLEPGEIVYRVVLRDEERLFQR
jgi:hypothetical protein